MNREAGQTGLPVRSSALVDVAGMATFVAVIQAASFTSAARRLGTSKSVVSRRIAEMEHQLGTRLIDRTAARVNPTEVGAVYFAKCTRILESVEAANDFVTSFHGGLRGSVRVSVPHFFCAAVVAPILTQFACSYPDLKVEVELDDRGDAMQDAGFDVALRIGRLADSSLVGRTLTHSRMWLCASRGYVQANGGPASPEELAGHDCLVHASSEVRSGWWLQQDERPHLFRLRERLRSACYFHLLEATRTGLGIGLLPGYLIADAVASGELVLLLADSAPAPVPISVVYPASRRMSQKVQALIGFLADRLPNPAPWEAILDQRVLVAS